MSRNKLILAGILVIGLAVAGFSLVSALPLTFDLRSLAEKRFSAKFKRPVTIGKLAMTLADPIHIELDDLNLANAPWGSAPDMLNIGHVEADLMLGPLLKGDVKFTHLTLDHAKLVLERDQDGTGNWKFAGPDAPKHEPPADHDRGNLPTMLDLVLHDCLITFRTTEGHILKIDLQDVSLRDPAEDQAATMAVKGAYNDVPVTLKIGLDSFDRLHDASQPFRAGITGEAPDFDLALQPAMMDPLNFDLVQGPITIKLKRIDALQKLLGVDFHADLPLELQAELVRQGDDWQLHKTAGQLLDSRFKGELALHEGSRHEPDQAKLDLAFDSIDLDSLLARTRSPPSDKKTAAFEIDEHPGTLLDARLAAQGFNYGDLHIGNLKTAAKIERGVMALSSFDAELWGGKLHGSAQGENAAGGNRLTVTAAADHLDAAQALRYLGSKHQPLTGSFDSRVQLVMTGKTTAQLKNSADGYAIVVLHNGTISKREIQLASADITAVFAKADGTTPLDCLATVMVMRDGVGTIAPFRLESQSGSMIGGGQLNLPANTVDFTFKTERRTTGFFALDLPIHIGGPLDSPHAEPASTAAIKAAAAQTPNDLSRLPGNARELFASSPCAQPAAP